jgi:hypothetical protein
MQAQLAELIARLTSQATVPVPQTATTVHYDKIAPKPKPNRFDSKNFQEYQRWIEDVKNNFMGRPYSESEKVLTAASWLGGEHQSRWIEYKQTLDLSQFTFDNFIDWIEARIETKTARSLNAYIDLERLEASINGSPQTFYNKFSHLYDQSRSKAPINDQDKIMAFIAKLQPWLKVKILHTNPEFRDMTACLEEATRLWKLYKDDYTTSDKTSKRNRDDSDKQDDKPRKGASFKRSKQRHRGYGNFKNNHDSKRRDHREDKSKTTCYRCDRTGHRISECFATHHRDGTKLPPKDSKNAPPKLHVLSKPESNDEDNNDDQ